MNQTGIIPFLKDVLSKNPLRIHNKLDTGELLQDALDSSRQGLVFFDGHDNATLFNQRARIIAPGLCSRNQAPLSAFLNFIFDHAIECDESLRNVLDKLVPSGGGTYFREVIAVGDAIYVAKIMKSPAGRTVLQFTDASDFKKHEELFISLHNMSHDLAQAVEATTNGIILARENKGSFEICFANQALGNLLKVAIPEILGQDLLRFLKTMLNSEIFQKIDQSLAHGLAAEAEFPFRSDNQICWRNLQLTKVRARTGATEMYIGVLTDTTEARMREQSAFQAQKMEALGQLAAGVAHDFNNLLSLIDGHARAGQQAISTSASSEKINDSLQKVRSAAERGAGLVRQMLTFSRHQIVSDSALDLCAALRDQAKLLQPLLTSAVELRLNLPKQDASNQDFFVRISENTLVQIVMNLVINARDAMPQGGRVELEIAKADSDTIATMFAKNVRAFPSHQAEFAVLTVRDNGTGIPAEVATRIFEPFFTTKGGGSGTGLGLYVVYSLVRQIGGAIDVSSAPDKGTTFRILLPLSADAKPQHLSGDVSEPSTLRFDGYTALVVEDEPELLGLLSMDLQRAGFRVLPAEDGDTALVVQDDEPGRIDILLTDVMMPRLNGVKLAALMRDVRPEIGIVFMSGYPGSALGLEDIPKDAVFLSKPLQIHTMLPVLRNVLEARKAMLFHPDTLSASRWESRHDIFS
ncbi:MAG: ATP-binding protein [Alphaproteobacteria bacterium]|nr:ATP-binding protein [Alphaproteobacteria bacterium]